MILQTFICEFIFTRMHTHPQTHTCTHYKENSQHEGVHVNEQNWFESNHTTLVFSFYSSLSLSSNFAPFKLILFIYPKIYVDIE